MNIDAIRRRRLSALIAERFTTQAALASQIGRQADYLSRVLAGKKGFGEKLARDIERLCNLESGWLDRTVDGDAPKTLEPPETIPAQSWRRVPVVGTTQLGDNGHWTEIEYPVGHGDGYIDWPTSDSSAYALRCRGNSMAPRVKHGEFVVCEPSVEPFAGDEVLVKATDGRVMVKELVAIRDGMVRLLSVNEDHPPILIPLVDVAVMHYVSGIARRTKWTPGDSDTSAPPRSAQISEGNPLTD